MLGQALELETMAAKFDRLQKELLSTQDSVVVSDETTDTETEALREALGEDINSDIQLRTRPES